MIRLAIPALTLTVLVTAVTGPDSAVVATCIALVFAVLAHQLVTDPRNPRRLR